MAKINNSDLNKIKVLISKVEALADKGVGGEKENAKIKLKELLDKYNIKKFKENENKLRTFKLVDFADCKTIMTHCIIDTKKDAEIEGYKTKKELYCKLTDKEYIEVCEKFNHYYPEFYKQREAFIKAFIIKNDLGIIDSGQNNEVEDLSMINNMLKSVSQNKFGKNKTTSKNPYLIAC
jgi:hypothetical protein